MTASSVKRPKRKRKFSSLTMFALLLSGAVLLAASVATLAALSYRNVTQSGEIGAVRDE